MDGKQPGGGSVDKVRIKIWDKNNGNAVVYDTQPGGAQTAAPTTALGGGDITLHTNGGGAAPPRWPDHRGPTVESLDLVLLDDLFVSELQAPASETLQSAPPPLLVPTSVGEPWATTAPDILALNRQPASILGLMHAGGLENLMAECAENPADDLLLLDQLARNRVP